MTFELQGEFEQATMVGKKVWFAKGVTGGRRSGLLAAGCEARRLADPGVLLAEIAERLHSDVGKVRGWVSRRRR